MAENFFGISDTGRVRSNNEDTFIAERVLDKRYILACVIDGVGGYEGGEVAAAIARDAILDHFKKATGDIVKMMKDALVAVNENIQSEKQRTKDKHQMACVLTLAMVDTENNKFQYAHVGDTRLYLLRDNSLIKITKDHSFVGFLEDTGRLTEAQAMKHPKRNEINKALGFDNQVGIQTDYIETGESPFLPGDMILVCSDGLTDMVSNGDITSILISDKSLEDKGKELVRVANEKGGKDNITVALVYHDAARVKQEATRPSNSVKKKDDIGGSLVSMQVEKAGVSIAADNKAGGNKGIIAILFIVCLILLGTLIWVYMDSRNKEKAEEVVPVAEPPEISKIKGRNVQERKLLDSMNKPGFVALVLVDSVYGESVTVTDSFFIQKDSLYIRGGANFTLKADDSFAGPAFVLSQNCKYIFLDSLTIENFDVGLLASNNALHLRNVKFVNCRIPVQYQFALPNNAFITGGIRDTALFRIDSLQKSH